MAFRADEEIGKGTERALRYLIPRHATGKDKTRCHHFLLDLIDAYGPVVESYPSWHPLVSANEEDFSPVTTPSDRCGYEGLDHTIFFAHGFVTCPYGDNWQKVLDSVHCLPNNPAATIHAEKIEETLYNDGATPVLVYCKWEKSLPNDRMIPKSLAIPLLLEKELPCWRHAQVAETWESMRPYFLGTPNGSRSSLFISQETGQVMKNIWKAIINTGMYGPIKVD